MVGLPSWSSAVTVKLKDVPAVVLLWAVSWNCVAGAATVVTVYVWSLVWPAWSVTRISTACDPIWVLSGVQVTSPVAEIFMLAGDATRL